MKNEPLRAAEGSDPFEGAASFTLSHRLLRAGWKLTWLLLASWTPPPLHKWRIFLLRTFGAKVSYTAFIYGSTEIWYPPNLTVAHQGTLGPGVTCYCMAKISIGERAVISQKAHLCTGTHKFQTSSFQIYSKPITIGANAWVCAESFVAPGVSIGEGAVLAGRAAAFEDLEPWTIYRGNPAVAIGKRNVFTKDA